MHPAKLLLGSFESANGKIAEENSIRSWITSFAWLIGSCFIVALAALTLRAVEFVFLPIAAHASHTTYDATVVSLSVPASMAPGEVATAKVTFKNTGSSTWYRDGKNYASIYRYNATQKVEVSSQFATNAWLNSAQPVKLAHVSVAPGGMETLSFPIKAPANIGTYQELFILTAENAAWIKNGQFIISIRVQTPTIATLASAPQTPEVTAIPPNADWSAEVIDGGTGQRQVNIDERAVATLAFKNTGAKTWTRDGTGYLSLYAVEGTKERASTFNDTNWLSKSQAVKLKETQVKPGETGHFVLSLFPQKAGTFQESFALAAEDTAWVFGSAITMPIKVPYTDGYLAAHPEARPASTVAPTSASTNIAVNPGTYSTVLLLRSVDALSLAGNVRQDITLGFKNTGKSAWSSRSLRVSGVATAVSGISTSVRDDSWNSPVEPIKINGLTQPGEIGFLSFKIKAPAQRGTYNVRLALNANDQPVDGGEIEIPVTVTEDGVMIPAPVATPPPAGGTPTAPNATPSTNPIPLNGDVSSLPDEPIIRVGIFKTTDNQLIVRAKYAPVLVQQNGSTVCRLNVGDSATVLFDRTYKVYKLSGGNCGGQATTQYVFRAEDGISAMEIADFSRPLSWLPGANDNTFRAKLELRYTPQTDNVWVINELPIEWYLKGIAETSNSSPQEYQRALLTAARTYAMYHVQRGTKHKAEFYTVDATFDQVYRGYGAEARDNNVVAAIDATRGQIVTYNGELALTPYYSRSDGRTRGWTEVWGGGPYAWLVSVPVPWDQGKTLWGHGVGLSATGALGMAADGKRYDEILRYFYQQTELRKAYK
jgi:hypothetical protein